MSFNPPEGILDIGNATLRVAKLEVAETTGLNQGLQNIVKNDLLVTEKNESSPYTTKQTWGLKLPTTWVGEFEVKGQTGKYIEFNFYNEGSTSNAQGYTLNFEDTSLTLKYDNQPADGLATATIPTIVGTFRKVNIFFERGVIAVSIDGIRYLYYKESDTFNNGLGVASRVVSATGGAFVNLFFEGDHSGNSQFKNLRIVNGRFISDKTSNVSFIGSLGVGVNNPKESLDIRGNMHLTRVSNVSQVSVDSNVVTEYTGPHDRPLRKYPEVALTVDAETASGYKGYKVTASSVNTGASGARRPFRAFDDDANSGARTNSGYSSTALNTSSPDYDTSVMTITDTAGTAHLGHWLKLELPKRVRFTRAEFDIYDGNYAFKDYVILGSDDNTNWTLLDEATAPDHDFTTHFTSTGYFKYILISIKTIYTNNSTWIINTIKYYGHEEGSASLDTTLKTVYNVPATTGTQLEVYYDAKDLTTMPTNTVTDLAGGDQNGTVTGHSPTLDSTDGINSFKFDGTDDYIESTLTNDSGAWIFSKSLWFKQTANVPGTLLSCMSSIGDYSESDATFFYLNDAYILVSIYSSGAFFPAEWVINEWTHAVAVLKGTTSSMNEIELYINGKKVEPTHQFGTATTRTLPANAQLRVGREIGVGTSYFTGSIANFRIYSKALNADQVKELYDYQKDYFLGSKSQVTLYKGHLGIGVTEPSGQLELAGDERIQEYPPRSITALNYHTHIEGHGEFEFYSSQSDTNYLGTSWDFTTVFENTERTGGGWHGDGNAGGTGMYQVVVSHAPAVTSGAGLRQSILKDGSAVLGEWIEMRSPYAINITNIATVPRTNYGKSRGIGKFAILGSNNGIDWEYAGNGAIAPHDTSSTTDAGGYGTYQSESIAVVSTNSNGYYYTYHRLVVTHIMGHRGASGHPQYSSGAYEEVNVSYLRFYGTPSSTALDKGSLSLGRSLDVPRISRYDVDTETPRPEKLVVDFDTTVNSSLTDISGNGNHGTFSDSSGLPTYSPADKAFKFVGVNGAIYSGTLSPAMTGDRICSMSAWFKTTNASTVNQQIVWLGAYSIAGLLAVAVSNGTLRISIGSGCSLDVASVIESNKWYHVVGIKQGTGSITSSNFSSTFKLYLNGEPMTGTFGGTARTLNITTNYWYVGAANATGSEPFPGYISNPKLYNTVLEPSEIKKLYRLGRTGRSTVIADTAVGIGCAPEAQLDVRGDLQVRGAIRTPQRPVFYAYNSGAADTTQGFTGHLLFYYTKINVGMCYNTSDKKFYAPVSGYYFFEFQVLAREASGGAGRVETTLYKNGSNISSRAMAYTYLTGASDHDNLAFTTQLYLDAGNSVYPVIHACDSNMDVYYGEDLGHFSGFFIG